MNGKIYKITNEINGESYIGQTINSIDERFKQHKSGIFQAKKSTSKLQKAMVEYGINNFTIELLEENIQTMPELSAKETYYIIKFGTREQYNASFGGGPKKKKTRILQKSLKKRVDNSEVISYHKDFNYFKYPKFNLHDWRLMFYILNMSQVRHDRTVKLYFDEIAVSTGKISKNPLEMERFCSLFFDKSNKESDSKKFFESINIQKDLYFVEFRINDDFYYIVESINENFIYLEVKTLKALSLHYSILLYKKLAEFRNDNDWNVDLESLRIQLNSPESYVTSAFNARVLNKSMDELSKVFIGLTVKKSKRGQHLADYRFTWSGYND